MIIEPVILGENRRTTLTPRVLVVVLNWNRYLDTAACVESLLALDYPAADFLVCDNDSADFEDLYGALSEECADGPYARRRTISVIGRTSAEAGGPDDDETAVLRLVRTGGNLGYAGGNNVAMRYALKRGGYDYVWLLNNDTVVAPDALNHMVDLMQRDRMLGITGSTHFQFASPKVKLSLGGGPFNKWLGIDTPYKKFPESPVERIDVDHVLGASMLVRMEAIRDVGLMDERYFLFREETDWCFRMREAGWTLTTALLSSIWHRLGGTIVHRSPVHDYYSTRNMLLLTQRFSPRTLPTVAAYTLVRAVLPKLLRGQFGRIPHVLRAYRDFFAGVTGYVDLFPSDETAAKTVGNTVAGA